MNSCCIEYLTSNKNYRPGFRQGMTDEARKVALWVVCRDVATVGGGGRQSPPLM